MDEVQDLTKLGAEAATSAAAPPARASQIVEKPYDPGLDRETIRGTIALALVSTLVGVIAVVALAGLVTIFACHVKDACDADIVEFKTIRTVAELVMTPLIGLVGAVTGFYFGEKSAASRSGN